MPHLGQQTSIQHNPPRTAEPGSNVFEPRVLWQEWSLDFRWWSVSDRVVLVMLGARELELKRRPAAREAVRHQSS
jgi:hypothetical protein